MKPKVHASKSKISFAQSLRSCHESKSKISFAQSLRSCHASKMTTLLILTLLASIPAFGQGLGLKYQGPLGYYTTESQIFDAYNDRMDFDGDGVPELVLEQVNEQGKRIEFLVINQADQSVLWILDESVNEALGVHVPEEFPFTGFFSFSATDDEIRFAVFGGPRAGALKVIDPSTNEIFFEFPRSEGKTAATDTLRFAIFDVDGDDYPDLIVNDPATQTVQVWGIETTSTATEEDIEAALLSLFQSYPNPFRTSMTITYEVEQPGPVTVTVYDALGRKVKTLVDARQPAGSHAVAWDGRDAGGQPVAAGTYFYRLCVGEAVMSKQAIRVK